MERIENYKKIIKDTLQPHANGKSNYGIDTYFVADDNNGQYLLVNSGWREGHRNYGCFLHICIKNDKVYIEYDGTDWDFAQALADAHIPKEDIVLAFQAPVKRPFTGYAVA